MEKFYFAAAYLRLSKEDTRADYRQRAGGSRTESNSIISQRDLIDSFIKRQKNMQLYDIYVDDGWSGTNFDRPAFGRMMQDIETGRVNCVIVKDLSRLGRDYIEAGRLIQKTFPAFSVRFIAIIDQFDSLTADYHETSLIIPVKNFVNDAYARDISAKVRSHQRVKREKGDFIGAFAPYGYKKSEENRNQLVPDRYAARIVRRIFHWKIEGYSNLGIAKRLEEMGVLSPVEYKKIHGESFQTGFLTGIRAKWSSVTVKRILTNENYTGTLVQGKAEKLNYKIRKTIQKPKDEWIRIEGTHQSIISKEIFQLVQNLLAIDRRGGKGEKKAHRYRGLLFCGDCKKPMIQRVNRYKGQERVAFICSTSNQGKGCSRHTISEQTLNQLVQTALEQQLVLPDNREKLYRERKPGIKTDREAVKEEIEVWKAELDYLKNELVQYRMVGNRLNQDLQAKILTKEEFEYFDEIYKQRSQELQQVVNRQQKTLEKLVQTAVLAEEHTQTEASADWLKQRENRLQIAKSDRFFLVSRVKRILVYEEKRVYLELWYGK
ncbi:MAG: recombinase family protein [Lachnospiraceae bacterium]|nr:recombinase family protein [Lachnospiraceae bacterium]